MLHLDSQSSQDSVDPETIQTQRSLVGKQIQGQPPLMFVPKVPKKPKVCCVQSRTSFDEYREAGDFRKSRFECISEEWLQFIRIIILIINFLQLCVSMSTQPVTNLMWYLTDWGHIMTVFSVFCVVKATIEPDSKYRHWAVISTQLAQALNMVITALFWIYLAPILLPKLSWEGYDLVMRIRLVLIHVIPIATTTTNIAITDMKLLSKDWTLVLVMGIFYMLINAFGTYCQGHEVYPIANWKDPKQTLCLYMIMAMMMAMMYYLFARLTEYMRPKRI